MKPLLVSVGGLLLALRLAAAVPPPEPPAAFTATLQSVQQAAPVGRLNWAELETGAQQLAIQFGREPGGDTLATLANEVISGRDPGRRELAVFTLAALAANQRAAVDQLERLAAHTNASVTQAALTGIGHLPPDQIRSLAARLAREAPAGLTRAGFIDLLATVGDRDSLTALQGQRDTDRNTWVQGAVQRALPALEHSLALTNPNERQQWDTAALAWWRAHRQLPDLARAELAFSDLAAQLEARGLRFPLPFLRNQLQHGDPLAAAVVGAQRETAAVVDLQPLVSQRGHLGALARGALRALGTPPARRALESALQPENGDVNRYLARELSQCGDQQSRELLARLSSDPRFTPAVRASFGNAAETLRQRLAARP